MHKFLLYASGVGLGDLRAGEAEACSSSEAFSGISASSSVSSESEGGVGGQGMEAKNGFA